MSVAGVRPKAAVQFVTVTDVQLSADNPPLNEMPLTQSTHPELFLDVPATKPLVTGQFVLLWAVHSSLSESSE
jgi:hypothetical protein